MRSNYMYIYMDVIEENLVLKKIWMVKFRKIGSNLHM